jgi:integrase
MPEITEPKSLDTEMLTEFFMRLQTRERIVGINTRKTGVKNSTIKTYWSKLNAYFEWLLKKNFIQNNPLNGIKPPEPQYEDQRALKDEDVRKLYSAVTLHSQNTLVLRRDTAMISLLLFCGLRLGEFISLEVRDIDFEKQLLTVRGQTSKSKRTRYIPIHPTLLFHLRDYITERNRRRYTTHYLIVSVSCDQGLSRHGLKHWVKSLNKKSGVQFHLHRFRHSFACNLAKKDVNAVKIQKLLGHNSLNMTMTYLRSIATEDLKNEINRLSI